MVSLAKANEIKKRHSNRLLKIPGVWGVGVEKDDSNQPVLVIHTDGQHANDLPSDLEGVPVKIVDDAPFVKQQRR
jgi:hypothetical protein